MGMVWAAPQADVSPLPSPYNGELRQNASPLAGSAH